MKAASRKVLLVTSSFPRWAGDTTTPFIQHIAEDLVSCGWQVTVLAPGAKGARPEETLNGVLLKRYQYMIPKSAQTICYNGGALYNLKRNKWNYLLLPFFLLAQYYAVTSELNSGEYCLVHSHWLLPQGLTAGLAAKRFNVPHICTIHGSDVFGLQGKVSRFFKKQALKLCRQITTNSSVTTTALLSLDPTKQPKRISIGITPTKSALKIIKEINTKYRKKSELLLLYVGRIVEQKGVFDLIDALAILSQSDNPNDKKFKALLVGDGPDTPRLLRYVQNHKLEDQVHFIGWVDSENLINYYTAADIFIGPSRTGVDGSTEAQGLTFAEAMYAKTPVIATRCGGIPDLVIDGETGLLVPEACPQAIVKAVSRLRSDNALKEKIIKNGFDIVSENYLRMSTAKNFSILYNKITVS